jgi:hypothetical protein
MKKIVSMLILMFAVAMVFDASAATTQVAAGAYRCQIDLVGQFTGRAAVLLTSDSWGTDKVWVVLNGATEKNLLATALTARSLGADVWCYIMGDSVIVGGTPMQTLNGVCIYAD